MCEFCKNYEDVCLNCGKVKHTEHMNKIPYLCERRALKELAKTSEDETFVWIMKYRNKAVKVGVGTLKKLFNETLPNPRYVKFDSVIIYWCNDISERNAFGTLICGLFSDSICNRQGWKNATYCKRTELLLPHGDSSYLLEEKYADPIFYIGDNAYWDVRALFELGIKRKKLVL